MALYRLAISGCSHFIPRERAQDSCGIRSSVDPRLKANVLSPAVGTRPASAQAVTALRCAGRAYVRQVHGNTLFAAASVKQLRKSAPSFVLSVCPCVLVGHLYSHRTDLCEILYWRFVIIVVGVCQFWLKSDASNRYLP